MRQRDGSLGDVKELVFNDRTSFATLDHDALRQSNNTALPAPFGMYLLGQK